MGAYDELYVDVECPRCGQVIRDYVMQFKFGAPECREVHLGDTINWEGVEIVYRLPSRRAYFHGLPGYRRVAVYGYGEPCSNCGYAGECEVGRRMGGWHFEILVENDVLVGFRSCTVSHPQVYPDETFIVLEE